LALSGSGSGHGGVYHGSARVLEGQDYAAVCGIDEFERLPCARQNLARNEAADWGPKEQPGQ
jgi:hypothetical protein